MVLFRSPVHVRGRPTKSRSSWVAYSTLIIFAGLALAFLLGSTRFLQSHQTVNTEGLSWMLLSNYASSSAAGIIPFDLSVNHLQLIPLAGGALPEQAAGAPEDFLPIVAEGERPNLRFRLRARVGASPIALENVSAYQIRAVYSHSSSTLLWDSGKTPVLPNDIATSVEWGGDALQAGTVVKWQVSVWDNKGAGPSTSDWTKFGVGPRVWIGQWMSHPDDSSLFKIRGLAGHSAEECQNWEARRPLPVARARVNLSKAEAAKTVTSALLVVSGLGSFATTFDGAPLSSSSVLDPAMMDYTSRVSYRGYDVTSHFQDGKKEHMVGIVLGSGWWDSRPLNPNLVKFNLLPRGPLTAIAEMHLHFNDGTTALKIPSGAQDWRMAKGYIRDSDIFTGERIDLGLLRDMEGWDSVTGAASSMQWVEPVLYSSDATRKVWRDLLHERSGATRTGVKHEFSAAPIGKLIPSESPPVMPIERLAPESTVSLGNGRWLLDFGKGMSGVLRFDEGLPAPIKPTGDYPRAHNVFTREGQDESFITVVYGDSLEMETGDINLVLVSGSSFHDSGPRARLKNVQERAGPCYPGDHGTTLAQKDVFILPKKSSSASFSHARQPLFTFHGFRFAEVCCTETPPTNAYAVAYRSSFPEWGKFDSSNILLNGAYELTKNAMNSNTLGTQTDCPHRERLQYGGDLAANSPAAMHFFDLSAFYAKVIHDWTDTQWNNGAYTETSIFQALNEGWSGIGHGAGETVWASLPTVLTVRHTQHYGDMKLVEETFDQHVKWLEFLESNWDAGMKKLFYDKYGGDSLESYDAQGQGGLGDWLAVRPRDTWLTHHAFYMASARAIAYLAKKLKGSDSTKASQETKALSLADKIKDVMNSWYMKYDSFAFRKGADWTPGPALGLFARIVPGQKRCAVLKNWIQLQGNADKMHWPGDEEKLFYQHLNKPDLEEMIKVNMIKRYPKNAEEKDDFSTLWSRRHNMPEGILAIRYTLKALSDSGFHNIALTKATGVGYPSFEYMLSHNATTMWETWWRSEDVYSRNHPMLGAVAEWLASSVAGVSLSPTTVAGRELLFWPRIPTSAKLVQHASATQGTKQGDASIAWKFIGLPDDQSKYDSGVVEVCIRVLVPPGSKATMKLPARNAENTVGIYVKYALKMPDLLTAKSKATLECVNRRKAGMGFQYNWEYSREKKEWNKFYNGKAIGTPCPSYLFNAHLDETLWSQSELVDSNVTSGIGLLLQPGLYDFKLENWQLSKEIEDNPGYKTYDVLQHKDDLIQCSDPDTFSWQIDDATHFI